MCSFINPQLTTHLTSAYNILCKKFTHLTFILSFPVWCGGADGLGKSITAESEAYATYSKVQLAHMPLTHSHTHTHTSALGLTSPPGILSLERATYSAFGLPGSPPKLDQTILQAQ